MGQVLCDFFDRFCYGDRPRLGTVFLVTLLLQLPEMIKKWWWLRESNPR
jgi:hypothetical protein